MTDDAQREAAERAALVEGLLEIANDQLALIKQQHDDLMRLTQWQQSQLNALYEALRRPQVFVEGKR